MRQTVAPTQPKTIPNSLLSSGHNPPTNPYTVRMINVAALLESAHVILLDTVDGLSITDWNRPFVDGSRTSRDIFAQVTAVEMMLVALVRPNSTHSKMLEMFCGNRPKFDAAARELSADWSLATLFNQYEAAHDTLITCAAECVLSAPVPQRGLHRYGRTVADCLIALGYGHKLIHATQIGARRQPALFQLSI